MNIDISICHNKGEKVEFVWSEKTEYGNEKHASFLISFLENKKEGYRNIFYNPRFRHKQFTNIFLK